MAYAASYGIATLPFRFFNVYGPRQAAGHAYAAVIPRFVDAALQGQPLQVHGDGLQSRDFTFVDTVTWALADAVHRRVVCDRPVNLALGTNTQLLSLVSELEVILDTSLEVEHQPPRIGDVRSSEADPTLLNSYFPDIPRIEFTEGLRKTVAWFRTLGYP